MASAGRLSDPTAVPPSLDLADGSDFLRAAGLALSEVSGQRVRGTIQLGAEHHTPWGVVHGGVFASAAETAASVGASTAVADRGQIAVGTSNTTDFLRSATDGQLDVEAVPVQQGRVQQLWDVRLTDTAGKLLARATVRLQNVPAA